MALNLLNDPIELKKISLKISTLKDYLEALKDAYKHAKDIEEEEADKALEINNLINNFFFHAVLKEHFIVSNPEESEKAEFKGIPLRPDIHPDKLSLSNTFLADINLDFISFFSVLPFIPGQAIVIEFNVPNNFTICAEVEMCQNYNLYSKIISKHRPRFRIKAKFNFPRQGEKTLLRNFLKSVEPPKEEVKEAPASSNEEEEEEVA